MIKNVDPDSFGFNEKLAQIVNMSSRGLRGNDLNAFVKRAGVDFLPNLEQMRPGEIPIHWLAVGATETFGANRNADGFSARDCREHHDTFRKFGHLYLDHANKDPARSYGRIIKTAFHEPMQRIELLIGVNSTKEAAERNGGLVATRILEKLASGQELKGSMACRVAYDCCSFCDNKARSRDEYCDDRPVKLASGRVIPACSGFGCRTGLTKVAADGRQQFVDNPNPVWFDFSDVYRNADRIALGMGVLEKAASSPVIGGAEMAEALGITAPTSLIMAGPGSERANARVKLAADMALAERNHEGLSFYDGGLRYEKVASPPDDTPSCVFRALADAGAVLPLPAWLELMAGKEASSAVGDVAARLPGVYGRMLADDGIVTELDDARYDPSPLYPSVKMRTWAEKLAFSHGLSFGLFTRAQRAAFHDEPVPVVLTKAAGVPDGGAEKLAREYAKYQLAYLAARERRGHLVAAETSLLARRNVLTF